MAGEQTTGTRGELIGLVPAAGRGSRLAGVDGSKEIVPIGLAEVDGERWPRPAATYLLEAMTAAGVARAWIVLRPGKEDVARVLGDGGDGGDGGGRLPPLAYLTIEPTAGVPETVDRALPAVGDAEVAFGFPDILFEPTDALARLLAHRRATGADLALALFPTDRPEKADLVELDPAGRIRRLLVKPGAAAPSHLRLTWILAVWTVAFSRFLHDFLVRERQAPSDRGRNRELYMSDVIQAAVDGGMPVATLPFPAGTYLDVGTPDDLARARRRYGP